MQTAPKCVILQKKLVSVRCEGPDRSGRTAQMGRAMVAEMSSVLKVRIPTDPPLALAKAFSRSGSGRIFLLFSRVMRVGPSAAPADKWPGSGLSGPIFSGPHDCAILVNSLQSFVIVQISCLWCLVVRHRWHVVDATGSEPSRPPTSFSWPGS